MTGPKSAYRTAAATAARRKPKSTSDAETVTKALPKKPRPKPIPKQPQPHANSVIDIDADLSPSQIQVTLDKIRAQNAIDRGDGDGRSDLGDGDGDGGGADGDLSDGVSGTIGVDLGRSDDEGVSGKPNEEYEDYSDNENGYTHGDVGDDRDRATSHGRNTNDVHSRWNVNRHHTPVLDEYGSEPEQYLQQDGELMRSLLLIVYSVSLR